MADSSKGTTDPGEKAVTIFVGVVLVMLNCFGVPINIAAIKMLAKRGTGKLVDKLPISMCICNLIQMFPLYLLNAVACFRNRWLYGEVGCYIYGFWVNYTANVLIWHLASYAIEQRKAVNNSAAASQAWRHTPGWQQLLVLSLIWLQGLFWGIAPFAKWGGYELEGLQISCSVAWERTDTSSLLYTIMLFMASFVLPVLIIIYCYVSIFKRFRTHVESMPSSISTVNNAARNQAKLRKLALIGVFMTASFVFAWSPYAIGAIATIIRKKTIHPILATLPAVFAKCSCIIYPTIMLLKRASFKWKVGDTSGSKTSKREPQTSELN